MADLTDKLLAAHSALCSMLFPTQPKLNHPHLWHLSVDNRRCVLTRFGQIGDTFIQRSVRLSVLSGTHCGCRESRLESFPCVRISKLFNETVKCIPCQRKGHEPQQNLHFPKMNLFNCPNTRVLLYDSHNSFKHRF